ncbi:DUF3915 family protein [Bacillus manliponensis]|uniref:DUF3915 family protein n=1 Tax=Bacillus manliponensis TaxID=574376 RepID=UPI00068B61B9|nr:DUF3915 family protein [Bacillus manliponensis]
MFGCFGCRDDFRDFKDHKDFKDHDDCKNDNRNKRPFCNLLANICIGTTIRQLTIRNDGTFNNLVFEGFANGVALFSTTTGGFTGLLRVCPEDITSIII